MQIDIFRAIVITRRFVSFILNKTFLKAEPPTATGG